MKPSEMSTSRLSAAIDHFIMEHHLEHSLLNDLIEEMEARLRNSIPRTDPPTVEDVGDDQLCLAFDRQTLMWMHRRGGHLRSNWSEYTHWLPMPPKPKGTQDETE